LLVSRICHKELVRINIADSSISIINKKMNNV
jgi:hypothetical protein